MAGNEPIDSGRKPLQLAAAAREEQLTELVLRHSRLTAEEGVLLRAVFPAIFEAHHDSVWNQIRRRGLDEPDAEDLVQTAFATLYQDILARGFPDSLGALLRSITQKQIWNHVRGKKRAPDSVALPSSGSEKPTSQPDVERALDLRELSKRLLPRLSPQHREVVDKMIVEGLSYAGAAAELQLPEGTVKSRYIAAKRALFALAELFLPPSQRPDA